MNVTDEDFEILKGAYATAKRATDAALEDYEMCALLRDAAECTLEYATRLRKLIQEGRGN